MWFNLGGVTFNSANVVCYNQHQIFLNINVTIPMSPRQYADFDSIMLYRIGKNNLKRIAADESIPQDAKGHSPSEMPGITIVHTEQFEAQSAPTPSSDGSGNPDVSGGLVPPPIEDIAAEGQLNEPYRASPVPADPGRELDKYPGDDW